MSVILDSEFATAEDTAAALGVSARRLKRLLRVAGPEARAERTFISRSYKPGRNGKLKKAVSIAGRRKPTRGKAKKAAH
jgi:hypothetical protein